MSRTNRRKGFTPDVRMSLVEEDLDDFEVDMDGINSKLDTLISVGVRATVGLATATVLLGINVALGLLSS